MRKKIAILGSTGSIGKNALKVIDALGSEYEIVALTAHNNIELLAQQVKKYKPKMAAVTNPKKADAFRNLIGKTKTEIYEDGKSLSIVACLSEVDVVIAAVVGAAGLEAILNAAKAGKTLAIANKEPLVIAGSLLTKQAKESGAKILPVDSEHSAIFQALRAGSANEVNKIILTASGGPFRNATKEQIQNATIEQALAHPTWSMGKKITVDSATMMNKALEVIEAKWLFDVNIEKIDVLVHPESIIHSMVEFIDGSIIAQMSDPDMCLPIQYALTFPNRVKGITSHLKLEQIGKLTFQKPDLDVFKALKIGFEVARVDGTAAAVFNAANEAAVKEFLEGKIKFANIVEIIEQCLDKHNVKTNVSLEELLNADSWARNEVTKWLNKTM
ncbi:MAG: 1-deoxy-D-xylulose-5-phosphate reductoisomerase [Phycisphaerales bacterium]